MKKLKDYLENQLSLQKEKRKILDTKISELQEILDEIRSEPDSKITGSEEC